jgi:hypothetical protein
VEVIIAILVVIMTLAAVNAAALTWGVDSMEGLADDRAS